jgi:hypothetical protein
MRPGKGCGEAKDATLGVANHQDFMYRPENKIKIKVREYENPVQALATLGREGSAATRKLPQTLVWAAMRETENKKGSTCNQTTKSF